MGGQQQQAERLLALAEEKEIPFLTWVGAFSRSHAVAEPGCGAEEIAELRRGVSAYRAAGGGVSFTYILYVLAHACSSAGQTAEGMEALTEAFEIVRDRDERFLEAELYRLQGELTLQIVPSAERLRLEAEGYFLKAIEVARCQQAKAWELRAATSLARLWRRQGKAALARQTLAGVYYWFTEGSDTADLQEARLFLASPRA